MKPPKLSQSVALSRRLISDRRFGGTAFASGEVADRFGRAAGSIGEMGRAVDVGTDCGRGGGVPGPVGGGGVREAKNLRRKRRVEAARRAGPYGTCMRLAGAAGS